MKKLLIFSLSMVLVFIGCESQDSSTKTLNVIKVATLNDPQTLDPRSVRDLSTVSVLHMLYEGLMRSNHEGDLEPGIAKTITISKDLKTYTFKLRSASWSNGKPVTATDFVETWKSVLNPNFPAPNAYQLFPIQGAKEAKEGTLPLHKVGIVAKDSKTLVVHLNSPTPYFLQLASSHFYFPVNQAMRDGKQDEIVTNGPYQLHNWRHHDEFVVRKNDKYWDHQQVQLDKIIVVIIDENTAVQMFENDEIDWVGSPMATIPQDIVAPLKESGRLKKHTAAGTHWFRFNTSRAPLHNVNLRQAFNLAINRQQLVNHVTQGDQLPALNIVPPCLIDNDCFNLSETDLTKAQKLFQEALREMKLTRSTLPEIIISYAYNDRNHKIAQTVQQQWNSAFDIEVRLNSFENKAFFEKLSTKNYQIGLGSWYADFKDPINFLEVFKYKDNSTNNTEWENPRFIALLDFSALQSDPKKRDSILEKAEQILISDVPIAPLFHGMFHFLSNDRVQDVTFSDLGYLDFKYAYVK